MDKLKEYNDKISQAWADGSTKNESELFFALSANINTGAVIMFWDNARGNKALIDYMKQTTAMLEKNSETNFSSNNPKPDSNG